MHGSYPKFIFSLYVLQSPVFVSNQFSTSYYICHFFSNHNLHNFYFISFDPMSTDMSFDMWSNRRFVLAFQEKFLEAREDWYHPKDAYEVAMAGAAKPRSLSISTWKNFQCRKVSKKYFCCFEVV